MPGGKEETKEEASVYDLMDYEDEKMIRDEILGRFVDIYVYSFDVETKEGKTTQYGISYAGIMALVKAANSMTKSRYTATDIPPVLEEHDTYWLAKVQCEDKQIGLKVWGEKRQPKYKKYGQVDEHADTIAVSKAQRNAFATLLPKTLILDFIRDYVEKKEKVKKIERPMTIRQFEKKAPEKVDERELLTQSIIESAVNITAGSKRSTGDLLREIIQKQFGKEKLSQLSLDELKALCVVLDERKSEKGRKKTEVSDIQKRIKEFFGDTN